MGDVATTRRQNLMTVHRICSTRAKFEVATKEALNPIAQDIKKGKLRCGQHPTQSIRI
jgi:hypothetical protein